MVLQSSHIAVLLLYTILNLDSELWNTVRTIPTPGSPFPRHRSQPLHSSLKKVLGILQDLIYREL